MATTTKTQDRKALDKLVKNCLKSASFRRRLENNPAATLKRLGIYTKEREKAVKRLRWGSLQKLAASFGYARYLAGKDAN